MAKKKAAKKKPETTPDEPGVERGVPVVPPLSGEPAPTVLVPQTEALSDLVLREPPPIEPEALTMGVDVAGTTEIGEVVPIVPESDWSDDDAAPLEDVKEATERILDDTGMEPVPKETLVHREVQYLPKPWTQPIEVPLLGDFDKGPGHVDAQLNRKQATTLRQIQHALDMGDYRMANGKHVNTKADVVRWLIDQIGGGDDE